MTFATAFLLLSILLIGSSTPQTAPVQKIAINQSFDLKRGDRAQYEEERVEIQFVSVPEDSRCPQGEQCISAGNAKIELKLTQAQEKAASIEINTAREPRESVYHGFYIRLVSLTPYPGKGGLIKPSDYVATLSVSKSATDPNAE